MVAVDRCCTGNSRRNPNRRRGPIDGPRILLATSAVNAIAALCLANLAARWATSARAWRFRMRVAFLERQGTSYVGEYSACGLALREAFPRRAVSSGWARA